MIKFNKNIFAVLTIVLLFACKEEIPFDMEQTERKIVLNTVLTVDSNLWAKVYLSNHVVATSNSTYELNNANVSVYSNNAFIETLLLQSNGYYKGTKHVIEANREYEYRVSAPNFNSVSAKEITPYKTNIMSVDSVGVKRLRLEDSEFSEDYVAYNVRFKDEPDKADFYKISIQSIPNEFNDFTYYNIGSIDPAIDDDLINYNSYSFYLTDRLFDGKEYSFEFLIPLSGSSDNELIVRLEHLSTDYYNYIKTYNMQKETDGLELFFQAVQVVNNIENGFGIMATSANTYSTFFYNSGFKK